MIRLLVALGLALAPALAEAQPQQQQAEPRQPAEQSERWMVSDQRILLVPARIAFPRSAGVLTANRHVEFSHQGEAVDNGIQYRSPDGAIIGTVYIYYPGLPHGGIAAFATDQAIRHSSSSVVSGGATRITSAGGIEGTAIRADYENYRDGMASSAAFVKAGRWIVKFRVTGPEARRAEVQSAMQALLNGVEFGRASQPRPAAPIAVGDCPSGSGERRANLLADPAAGEIAAHAFLATFDGAGIEATDESGARNDLPARVPADFCLSSRVDTRGGAVPILRAADGPPLSVEGRTVLVAVLSDSGILLEVVHAENLGRYVLLFHEVGRTTLLGGFDGVPSDAQISEIIDNPASDAARPRVPVVFRPGEGPRIYLPSQPNEEASQPVPVT